VGWFLAFLLNIILNYLYIHRFGMKAVALTSDIAYLFILVYLLVIFKRETKTSLITLLQILQFSFRQSKGYYG